MAAGVAAGVAGVAGLAAVLAAGVAGAAFCVTAGRDLLPMRLAWAMPGSTRPATVRAITDAEVRKEVFTAKNPITKSPGR